MILIAAADRKWGIGMGDDLLVSIPKDKKNFMDETLGKVVVMGRKTFESLPGSQPLYGRENVILSHSERFNPKGTHVCRSLTEALEYLEKYNNDDIYVIGGESIYRQFLPYCDRAKITAIDYEYESDRLFPNLDKDKNWILSNESEEETYFDLPYTFRLYKKIK